MWFSAGCEKPAPQAAARPVPAATTAGPSTASAITPAEKGPPSATYTVRGKVVDVPTPGRPQSDFSVHHEAIDGFADGSGRVVGMGAMTMPFPLGPGVTLEGIAVGDVVEITFPVWWGKGGPDYHVSKVVKLPGETALEFRPARPAK